MKHYREQTPRLFEAEFSLFLCFIAAALVSLLVISTAEGSATLVDRVHAQIMNEQPWRHSIETTEERRIRTRTIARSSVEAANGDRMTLAFLLTYGREESHWAQHVHAGECRKKGEPWPDGTPATRTECDHGQAATPWQVWRTSAITDEQWSSMQGTSLESTTKAAKYAANIYRMKVNACGSVIGGLSAYASGNCTNARVKHRAKRRLVMMQQIAGRL